MPAIESVERRDEVQRNASVCQGPALRSVGFFKMEQSSIKLLKLQQYKNSHYPDTINNQHD